MERVPRTKQPEPQITPQQQENLHAWDTFIEEITPKLQADHERLHAIELKPGGVFNLEREPRTF